MRRLFPLVALVLLWALWPTPYRSVGADVVRPGSAGSGGGSGGTNINSTDWIRGHWVIYSDMALAGSEVGASVLASGTAVQTATANHPSIRAASSSSSANSGVTYSLDSQTALLISGTEHFEAEMAVSRFTAVIIQAGFFDDFSVSATVDGVYIAMDSNGVITGVTFNNSATSVTSTSFQLVLSTFYRFVVDIPPGAATVRFSLYSEAGALLWTDTLAANIPTGAGRFTSGGGVKGYHTGSAAFELYQLDWMYVHKSVTR